MSINIKGEFESIIIEIKNKASKNIIIGEIYHVPNTSVCESIVRYEKIMTDIANTKNYIIIATDQNFDYMKINQNSAISDLMDVFYTLGILPTITRPTRITHSSATLIDNIYIKRCKYDLLQSRIIITDISDHLPVIACTGMHTTPNTREPLVFKHRPMNNEQENEIVNIINSTNWKDVLNNCSINDAYNNFTTKLTEILDQQLSSCKNH